ncbi:MAG: GNAT family N-acetyltransferase [Planctomycetota bacterium]
MNRSSKSEFVVRKLGEDEHARWLDQRERLWPDFSRDELSEDERRAVADSDAGCALVAVDASGAFLGFVEVTLRPFAEGCATRPVGYVEGWWVEPEHRGRGVGRALVAAAEDWSRARGCREIASDTEIFNDVSRRAHAALGFEEVDRVVLFRKELA